MKLLLHCCCAPCSIASVSNLRSDNIEPQLFWYNPNIYPLTEYNSRFDCLKGFAASEKLKLTSINEGVHEFLDGTERCEKCYVIRLEKTASFAAQEGFSAFSTTLLISPYQDHETIKRTGKEMAEKYGIEFFYRDFRPFFRESQNAARAKGYYMQKYCGCIYSKEQK